MWSLISKQFIRIICKYRINNSTKIRNLFTYNKPAILGIETSCDDTGIAIVDSTGKILGESIHSQLTFHLAEGGINPPVARDLHKENIQRVYEECLKSANMVLNDVDAIAVTVKPGIALSLIVGRDFALNLAKISGKPVIPIHHMQAHALTVRLIEKVDFPFLVLLMSGGHCILALAESVNSFKLLGQNLDNSPGESLDKIARRLKLMNIFQYSQMSGGEAIELAAMKADDPNQFSFPSALVHYRDCNFSFSGLKTTAIKHIIDEENKYNIRGADIIPNVNNLCASVLLSFTRHLCVRTERAMEFLDKNELIPEDKKVLVVSGGVASNNLITNGLRKICSETGYKLIKPPPKLCTDNGIMIAWNGVERYIANIGVIKDKNELNKIDIVQRDLIGDDWRQNVINNSIKRKWTKIQFQELICN